MNNLNIKQIEVGKNSTNCYILSLGEDCVIIDAGGDSDVIMNYIAEECLKPHCVVLTHGHFDHFMGAKQVADAYSIPIICHEAEFNILQDANNNGSNLVLRKNLTLIPDKTVADGDIITAGGLSLKCMHTPGHTIGGMCLLHEGFAFTGDTLFFESIGRTDLPTGDYDTIVQSIKKLYTLDEGTICYPGHGPRTTIAYEKENNAYVQS